MGEFKIENALYFDGQSVKSGDIYIKDGTFTFQSPCKKCKIINGEGYFFLPGLINAHHHTYSSLARGVPFSDVIRNFYENLALFWWRWDASLDEDGVYYSALLGAMESVKKGVTTIFDHHASFSVIDGSLTLLKKAFHEIGVRAAVCFEISDRLGKIKSRQSIRENERFIKEEESLDIKGLIGMHTGFTVEDDTMLDVKGLYDELKRPLHIHVAEDRFDRDYQIAQYGMSPVERLYRRGIIEEALLAHSIWVDERDISLISEHKAHVIHNPESNMDNAVGYFKIHDMLGEKVSIGIGTDGFSHSILMQVRNAVLNAQARGANGFGIFKEVLFRENANLAKHIFDAKIGKIAEGYVADLVGFKYLPFTPLNSGNVFSHIFFGLSAKEPDYVFIGGNLIVENGAFTNIDEQEICGKSQEVAKRQWERFGKNNLNFRV